MAVTGDQLPTIGHATEAWYLEKALGYGAVRRRARGAGDGRNQAIGGSVAV